MKKSTPSLREQLQPVSRLFSKYKKFLFVVTVLSILIFLVFRINQLANTEPSESMIDEKLQTVTRPRLDESAIQHIQQLQDQNVEVKSLFDEARNNPFSE